MGEFRGKIRVFLSYAFNCIFERYRDLPSVLLPQATLIVNTQFLQLLSK